MSPEARERHLETCTSANGSLNRVTRSKFPRDVGTGASGGEEASNGMRGERASAVMAVELVFDGDVRSDAAAKVCMSVLAFSV